MDSDCGAALVTRLPGPEGLPRQRAGDPLGLGLAAGARPPAPPDPDAYDRAHEDAEYARSLLSAAERAELDAELAESGHWTIAQVRSLVAEQTSKGSLEEGGLDPELLALIDARTDYKIFVAGDSIYSRAELYDAYPFHEFGVAPEAVFVQQEIGVFPPRSGAARAGPEVLARDAGDESLDFVPVEDLIRRETRGGTAGRRPLRVVKTKVFIGKQHWRDFEAVHRVCSGAVRIAKAAALCGPEAPPSPFLALFAPPSSAAQPRLPAAELVPEGLAREAEIRRREEEICRREAEVRRREEEAIRRLAAAERAWGRVEAELARIEAVVGQLPLPPLPAAEKTNPAPT
jgi:hypothetical protein